MKVKNLIVVLLTVILSITAACKDSVSKTPTPLVPYEKLVAPPEFVNEVVPVYPENSRLAGEEGKLLVEVTVGVSGRVEEARVLVSSGYIALDEAGLSAARKWTFTRTIYEGKPARTQLNIPFKFQLDE